MNKPMIAVLLSAVLGTLCGSAGAATSGTPGKSFSQAYAMAASARLSVRIATAEVDAAAARVAQAKAQFYPTLDLSYNADRFHHNDPFTGINASVLIPELNTSAQVAVTQTVPRYQNAATLSARYQLYTGGRTQAQLKQDELSLQAAEVARNIALQQVALDVSSAYFKLRRACMQTASASRQLRRAEALAELTRLRLRQGRVAPIEERVATLGVAEKQSAWRSRQEELELLYAGLRAALQTTAADEGPEQRCQFAHTIDADLEQVRQLSDQTLDLRHDTLKLAAARERVAVQRAALRPQLTLYSNYSGIGRSDSSMHRSLSDFSFRQFNVGLMLSFNLFDHGLTSQRVSEAEAEFRKQSLQADLAAAERDQQIRRRELNQRMVDTRIDLLRSRLELASAQADMARQQLKTDAVSASVVEERAELEQDARDELQAAQVDAALAQLALLFPMRTPSTP